MLVLIKILWLTQLIILTATATDFANWLVQHLELSFREAYQLTGKIVALC